LDCFKDALNVQKNDIIKRFAGKRKEIERPPKYTTLADCPEDSSAPHFVVISDNLFHMSLVRMLKEIYRKKWLLDLDMLI